MRTVGRRGLLVDTPTPAATAAALRVAAADVGIELAEVVPGGRTVLVVAALARDLPALGPLVRAAARAGGATGPVPPEVTIPVRYDGPDLGRVAEAAGTTTEEVVAAHAGASYVVAFCGFAPGFAYLDGLPASLRLPRRGQPRARVPAGSVAVAEGYSAVYPRSSPGGWHLLGTTDTVVWDGARRPPALLGPGTPVRFVPVP